MPLTRLAPHGWLLHRLCASLLGVALLSSRSASAAESEAARLFREGRELLVAGRFGEACAKLEQSQRLEPRVGTQLNLGVCQERLGKIATAWSAFRGAQSSARGEGDVARERFARSRVDALAPRVPQLRVRAPASTVGDALTLSLDGQPLPPSRWGSEQPLDPGEHVVVAARGGEEYWRTSVTLREAEHAQVAIPAPPPFVAGGAEPRPLGRFVYELGAFVGYIDVTSDRETPDENPARLQAEVDSETGSQLLNCGSNPCQYLLPGSSGFVVGVAGFLGYAVAAEAELGLRFLLGPRAGGGALAALGPSASFRLGGRYRVSPTVFFGTASHAGDGYAELSAPNRSTDIDARLRASLGFAIGLGSELSWSLTKSQTGAVLLQAVPLFLYGPNGLAWSLPLAVAYRWN